MPHDTSSGPFVPTTNIYDIQNIKDLKLDSPEFRNFLVRVRESITNIAILLNQKDSGTYETIEFLNGQLYFSDPSLNSTTRKLPTPRSVSRIVIDFGTLPNNGTTSMAHGITFQSPNVFSFTRIYGTTTDQTAGSYLPLPYASSTAANNIELSVDNTNVIITTEYRKRESRAYKKGLDRHNRPTKTRKHLRTTHCHERNRRREISIHANGSS